MAEGLPGARGAEEVEDEADVKILLEYFIEYPEDGFSLSVTTQGFERGKETEGVIGFLEDALTMVRSGQITFDD